MDIFKGQTIKGDGESYLVLYTQQFRTGYKYICRRASDNAKVSLDRIDVLRAIRSGDAIVTNEG